MVALLKTSAMAQERRRHSRVDVAIDGRLMLEDKREYTCETVDMSPGGIRLRTAARGRIAEKVIAYLDHFGRIEGVIVRNTSDGFALKLALPAVKRDKVADLLTWLANQTDAGKLEDRRHRRIVPRNPETLLQLVSGSSMPARIIDISISGVGVVIDKQPSIGARVIVGKTPGKVIRHFDNGIAVEFLRLVPSATFDEDIVL